MGGVSVLLEDILGAIDYEKYNVDVLILHNNGDMLENLPSGVNILYGTKFFNVIDLPIKEVLATRHIKKIIRKIKLVLYLKTGLINRKIKRQRKKILKKKYDVEIAFKDGFTAIFTANGDSTKKIHWLHSDYKYDNPNAKYKKLFPETYEKFDKIVGVSEGVAKHFNDIYGNSEKTIVIGNLVEANRITRCARWKKEHEGDELRIACVGRLHYYKGYDRLLHAAKRLKDEDLLSKIKIDIIGGGFERQALINLKYQLKLGKHVEFLGDKVNPYRDIKDADFLMLPSRVESFGLVVVESQILGIPVVATNCLSIEGLIENGKNGLIVENSTDGIYTGLKKMIVNRDLLSQFTENLKAYHYDNEKIIKQLNDLFA